MTLEEYHTKFLQDFRKEFIRVKLFPANYLLVVVPVVLSVNVTVTVTK